MTSGVLIACLALAVALVASGAVAAFTSANALKRVAAIVIALTGAVSALALLQAPAGALMAAVGVTFAYAIAGIALSVRLQEAYGGIEADEIDAADQDDEPRDGDT